MNDEKIVSMYLARDEKAISASSDKYGKYCFAVANNILGNDEDSRECVNDTWLRAWNSIPPAKPSVLKLFLAKITRNLAFDRYKKSHAQKRGEFEALYPSDLPCPAGCREELADLQTVMVYLEREVETV